MPLPLAQPIPKIANMAFTACVIALCITTVALKLTDQDGLATFASLLFVSFCLLGQSRFGLRERYLLTIAVLVTLSAFRLHPDAWNLLIDGLSWAGYLATFMILMTLLREGAMHSQSVLAIGRYLTEQAPGRRYVALHAGGHFFGVLLNFGAVSLLAPLIQRGIRAHITDGPPMLSAVREQRQLSAMTRGFSWFNTWSPTSIALAAVLATVPKANAAAVAATGMSIAFILLWVGWFEDRLRGIRTRRELGKSGFALPVQAPPDFPSAAAAKFLTVALGLAASAILVSFVADIPLVTGIMIAATPITVAWIVVQQWRIQNGKSDIGGRLKELFLQAAPAGSPEAVTLALAGYIGMVGAALVGTTWFGSQTGNVSIGPLTIYLLVAAIIPLASWLAMPPMLMVTFFGSLLAGLTEPELNPTLLALSLLCGWSLNLTGSPFGATSLVLGRVTGISGFTHAWRWNGVFTLLSYFVVALVLCAGSIFTAAGG